MFVKKDCINLIGSIPCEPHKKSGVHCENCSEYKKIDKKILIIKLGAAGDVIRTTPLLHKLNKVFPNSHITWLTYFPELVPKDVNKILPFELKNILWIENNKFDILYNLDKDDEAISLTEKIDAKEKFGFVMDEYGRCKPINQFAEHKYLTGLFDDISRANKKSYLEEIFEICGFKFSGEKYILDFEKKEWNINKSKKIVGLNTGCGGRWPSRLWANENWINLAKKILQNGYQVLWLGGKDEDEKNKFLQKESGGIYLGYFSLKEFISLVDQCDYVVTQVTMALHIAIGLNKKIVLMNNIFNKNEFELYGNGVIVEPDFDCDCYFDKVCPNNCMQYISAEKIYKEIISL